MRGLVIVLIVVVIIASLSFLVLSAKNFDNKQIENTKQTELEFSTFTSAVCEDKEDVVHCKDEVFVNCNGEISRAIDVAECNGIKLDVPKATGSAVFGKEWKDPRI